MIPAPHSRVVTVEWLGIEQPLFCAAWLYPQRQVQLEAALASYELVINLSAPLPWPPRNMRAERPSFSCDF